MSTNKKMPRTKEDPTKDADAIMAEIAKREIALILEAAEIESAIANLKTDLARRKARGANAVRLNALTEELNGHIARIFGKDRPRSRTCPAGRYGKHRVAKLRITSPDKVIAYARKYGLPLFHTIDRVSKPAIRAALRDGRAIPGVVLSTKDTPYHVVDRQLIEDLTTRSSRVRRNGRAVA